MQGAKKINFTACHLGKLKLAFTCPDVISAGPKTFGLAEFILQFFCYSNSSKNITCPSGKLKTDSTLTNWSVSCKLIPYSRPKLCDFYTLFQSTNPPPPQMGWLEIIVLGAFYIWELSFSFLLFSFCKLESLAKLLGVNRNLLSNFSYDELKCMCAIFFSLLFSNSPSKLLNRGCLLNRHFCC